MDIHLATQMVSAAPTNEFPAPASRMAIRGAIDNGGLVGEAVNRRQDA
jgi:hypothetical protein